ncbi:hypothetical protein QVD17_29587 [Tagetes erecta]|uniref:DUF3511 domain-containing protein n=1 Tax=Tagetes erecta TaxID=13708 RepID=A0AAD8NMI9_TARER|nr:hypothetical protein QVD17_29587 [Tagetes erecta]
MLALVKTSNFKVPNGLVSGSTKVRDKKTIYTHAENNANSREHTNQIEDLKYRSYNGNMMQIEPYNTHQSSSQTNNPTVMGLKRVNKRPVSRIWRLTDPELQRKKRIASYKAYAVEGRVKASIRKSFRWIKERYSKIVYGLS